VRLIDHDGTQMGVVSIEQARIEASQQKLDLLLVSDAAIPPVCKIIDFGQYKYQQQKKDKASKKGSKGQTVKELKMSPKIGVHDYDLRVRRGIEFLKKGYRVKLSVPFRGREIVHPELGRNLAHKFLEEIKEHGVPDGGISNSHRSLIVHINPTVK
jgi:translation initiation factor IF-3